MKWLTVFNVLSKLPIKTTKSQDVFALIDDKKVFLDINRMADGTPYFIKKKEKNNDN